MTKEHNKNYLIGVLICICIIIGLILVFSEKKLDPESDQIKELYTYLGEADIYHCGGLMVYSDKTITKEEIGKENTLCMAYYKVDKGKLTKETAKSTGKNESKIDICKVGESTTLAANEDTKECEYTTLDKTELNNAYQSIYGTEITDYEKFYITSTNACFLEGDKYYCGEAETFTYSLTPQSTVYRLINKVVKSLNGDIIIYDYFLKVSDNKCYAKNSYQEESSDCTSALSENKNEVSKDILTKYGTLYKHTFKKGSNGEYYWEKSEVNKK